MDGGHSVCPVCQFDCQDDTVLLLHLAASHVSTVAYMLRERQLQTVVPNVDHGLFDVIYEDDQLQPPPPPSDSSPIGECLDQPLVICEEQGPVQSEDGEYDRYDYQSDLESVFEYRSDSVDTGQQQQGDVTSAEDEAKKDAVEKGINEISGRDWSSSATPTSPPPTHHGRYYRASWMSKREVPATSNIPRSPRGRGWTGYWRGRGGSGRRGRSGGRGGLQRSQWRSWVRSRSWTKSRSRSRSRTRSRSRSRSRSRTRTRSRTRSRSSSTSWRTKWRKRSRSRSRSPRGRSRSRVRRRSRSKSPSRSTHITSPDGRCRRPSSDSVGNSKDVRQFPLLLPYTFRDAALLSDPTSPEYASVACIVCSMVLTNYYTVAHHDWQKHKTVKLYHCGFKTCRFMAEDKVELVRHMESHREHKTRSITNFRFDCAWCFRTFGTIGEYTSHVVKEYTKLRRIHYEQIMLKALDIKCKACGCTMKGRDWSIHYGACDGIGANADHEIIQWAKMENESCYHRTIPCRYFPACDRSRCVFAHPICAHHPKCMAYNRGEKCLLEHKATERRSSTCWHCTKSKSEADRPKADEHDEPW